MVRALKSAAFCGSIATFLDLKKSARVPEVAGTTAGTAGATGATGAAAAGEAINWLGPAAGAAACTVTVCVTVAGAGTAGSGSVGSAEAVGPARPSTHAV